jgi:hypothetical protein
MFKYLLQSEFQCFRMYSKDGLDIGQFNIYIRENNVLKGEPLWSMTRSQGNLWRTSSITIKSLTDFQV